MRKLKLISSVWIVMMVMGAMISCENEEGTEPILDDAELIAAIESAANKQDVSSNALPFSATTILQSDFSESFISKAQLAPELGYEVNLKLGQGADVGETSVAYFSLSGRELSAQQGVDGDGNDRHGRKRGRKPKGIRDCFDFVFPVSLTMPDASGITLNSKDDWIQVKDWYQANPDTHEHPEFVFPLQIVFGEETITINSQDEFREAKSACEVDRRRGRCFELEFPITFTMPDQSQITLQSKEDWTLVDDWYKANPEVDVRPDLVFPVDITYRNDSTVTINNDEEMMSARAQCETDRRKSACFDLVFPVTFVMPDDSEITLSSREDHNLIKDWYKANPDADKRPDLVFPVDIEFEDGTILTVNSEEELRSAKADCG